MQEVTTLPCNNSLAHLSPESNKVLRERSGSTKQDRFLIPRLETAVYADVRIGGSRVSSRGKGTSHLQLCNSQKKKRLFPDHALLANLSTLPTLGQPSIESHWARMKIQVPRSRIQRPPGDRRREGRKRRRWTAKEIQSSFMPPFGKDGAKGL